MHLLRCRARLATPSSWKTTTWSATTRHACHHRLLSGMSPSFRRSRIHNIELWEQMIQHVDESALMKFRAANTWLNPFESTKPTSWSDTESEFRNNIQASHVALLTFARLKRSECGLSVLAASSELRDLELLLKIHDKAVTISKALSNEDDLELLEDTAEYREEGSGTITTKRLLELSRRGRSSFDGTNKIGSEMIFRSMHEIFRDLESGEDEQPMLFDQDTLQEFVNNMLSKPDLWESAEWIIFADNVRAFVGWVTCGITHKDPIDNIAELGRFYAPNLQHQIY